MHKKNISQVKLLQNIDHWEDQLTFKTHSDMDKLFKIIQGFKHICQ